MYTGGDLEGFVVDLFTEASKFATVDEFLIAGNNNEHLNGTVYLSLGSEKGAEALIENFEGRWYNEMPLYCSLSPIKDLWGACCRDPNTCSRGGECNYLHPIPISREVLEPLFLSQPSRDRSRSNRTEPRERDLRSRDSHRESHQDSQRDYRDSRDYNRDSQRGSRNSRDIRREPRTFPPREPRTFPPRDQRRDRTGPEAGSRRAPPRSYSSQDSLTAEKY